MKHGLNIPDWELKKIIIEHLPAEVDASMVDRAVLAAISARDMHSSVDDAITYARAILNAILWGEKQEKRIKKYPRKHIPNNADTGKFELAPGIILRHK